MKNKIIFLTFLAGLFFIIAGFSNYGVSSVSEKVPVTSNSPTEKNPNLLPKTSFVQGEPAFVSKVIDGDTIVTSNNQKIRYIGVNAPEKGQPMSNDSTSLNQKLVLGKNIRLEFDVVKNDKYGRMLAYVFVQNDFINLDIVKNGLAVSETVQPNIMYQDKFLQAQKEARGNCLGIWAGLCSKNTQESCVRIKSINANAPGDDSKNKNGEWIEVLNQCSSGVQMKNWLIKDNSASNKYYFKDFVLESNHSIRIYSGCGKDTKAQLFWQCPEQKYAVWNNLGDHAFLYDEDGSLVSDYSY